MKAFILLAFCLCFCLEKVQKFMDNTKIHRDKPFLLYSSYYYNKSKLYSNDTLVMLFIAPKEVEKSDIKFDCFSVNITLLQTTSSEVRLGHRLSYQNPWNVFIATCKTTINPHLFGLTVPLAPKIIEINVKHPVQAGYPVAICYPPVFYESRWKQLIFSIEVHQYFGADMQIFYLNSASKEILDILDVYEAKGWIRIEKYLFYDFSQKNTNKKWDSMIDFSFNNHYMASMECLMKFREAADFIIIADIADVIVPRQNSFYNEFIQWKKRYPFAVGFAFYQNNATINVSDNIADFSLLNAFNSFKVAMEFSNRQTVFQTNVAETVWFFSPDLNNGTIINIPYDKASVYHIDITKTKKMKENDNFKPRNLISKEGIQALQYEFVAMFENFSIYQEKSLNVRSIHYNKTSYSIQKQRRNCIVKKCLFTMCPIFLKKNSSFRKISIFSLSSYDSSCNTIYKEKS